MSTLARFQDDFAQGLLDPDATPAQSVAALLRQPGFAVYRNTVMKGCIDALQANYPAVARLVGEEWFRAAAAIYVRSHLPSLPTLLYYGEDFADFLADFEPAAELPYLSAVARLDRFWTEAHAARDETPLDAAAVAALDAAQLADMVLHPHASARWAWCEAHPAYSIWSSNRAPDNKPVESDCTCHGALITRPDSSVQWMALDAAGCAFMDACAAGLTLADAAGAAMEASPDADLMQLMAGLLQAGAFGGMSRN